MITSSNNKQPFTVLSNNFSLARMNNPVWPGCFSCSEDDYVNYLTENQIAIFPWSSQARGFFLILKNLLVQLMWLILIKRSRIGFGEVKIISKEEIMLAIS